MSFTQCFPTCGRMHLPALSLWPGRQPCRPHLVDGRRGVGPSSVATRSRNPPTGHCRDSPISSLFSHAPPLCAVVKGSPLWWQCRKHASHAPVYGQSGGNLSNIYQTVVFGHINVSATLVFTYHCTNGFYNMIFCLWFCLSESASQGTDSDLEKTSRNCLRLVSHLLRLTLAFLVDQGKDVSKFRLHRPRSTVI